MRYPTLTWQAAHLLARAHAARGEAEAASEAARLAIATIETVSARAPELALRQTFLAWPRVQAARDDSSRLLRG
jgi:hypothetical protein